MARTPIEQEASQGQELAARYFDFKINMRPDELMRHIDANNLKPKNLFFEPFDGASMAFGKDFIQWSKQQGINLVPYVNGFQAEKWRPYWPEGLDPDNPKLTPKQRDTLTRQAGVFFGVDGKPDKDKEWKNEWSFDIRSPFYKAHLIETAKKLAAAGTPAMSLDNVGNVNYRPEFVKAYLEKYGVDPRADFLRTLREVKPQLDVIAQQHGHAKFDVYLQNFDDVPTRDNQDFDVAKAEHIAELVKLQKDGIVAGHVLENLFHKDGQFPSDQDRVDLVKEMTRQGVKFQSVEYVGSDTKGMMHVAQAGADIGVDVAFSTQNQDQYISTNNLPIAPDTSPTRSFAAAAPPIAGTQPLAAMIKQAQAATAGVAPDIRPIAAAPAPPVAAAKPAAAPTATAKPPLTLAQKATNNESITTFISGNEPINALQPQLQRLSPEALKLVGETATSYVESDPDKTINTRVTQRAAELATLIEGEQKRRTAEKEKPQPAKPSQSASAPAAPTTTAKPLAAPAAQRVPNTDLEAAKEELKTHLASIRKAVIGLNNNNWRDDAEHLQTLDRFVKDTAKKSALKASDLEDGHIGIEKPIKANTVLKKQESAELQSAFNEIDKGKNLETAIAQANDLEAIHKLRRDLAKTIDDNLDEDGIKQVKKAKTQKAR